MGEKRLDIQGLRALAVALVVAFHLWPDRVSGGYVGVDVFFVISGFLITAHLLSEVERTGTVSLTKFWARRVRRLLPAAFTVLGASLVAAFVILPKSLLQQTLYEIGAAALYVQNWVLAGNSVDYLGADNKPSLAQHYWSLSVEEQFYIAWPVLIIVAIWLAARTRRGRSSNRQAIAIALSVVFIASLVYSVYETARSQPSAYFITPTRAWEFAAGGLLVFVPAWAASRLPTRIEPALRFVAPWGGIALILYAAVSFDASSAFPGAIALLPVIGTMLLIYAGDSDSAWSPAHVFRFGPIQLLGDISYAVYLWHWPLIILAPFVLAQDLTLRTKMALLVITLGLAIATKFLIEDPVRFAKGRARRRAPSFAFMAAGIAVLVGVTGVGSAQLSAAAAAQAKMIEAAIESGEGCFGASAIANDCPEPFAVTDTVDPAFTKQDSWFQAGILGDACENHGDDLTLIVQGCEYGDTTNPVLTVALVGDSHAADILDPLVDAAKKRGWRVVSMTRPGCSGLEEAPPKNASELVTSCSKWGEMVLDEIVQRNDIDIVLYSNLSLHKTIAPIHAADIWNRVRASGKLVVAMHDTPELPNEQLAPTCVETSTESYDPCAWKPRPQTGFMEKAAADPGNPTPMVDLNQYLCQAGMCHVVIGGVIAYMDSHHLSVTFARTLAPYLGDQLDAIIARTQGTGH